jgi:phosphate-selective porin OprO and OprP
MRHRLALALLAFSLSPALAAAQGHTLIDSDNGSLSILNRAQIRFTEELPDDQVRLTGTDNPGEGKGAFRIRRAKTELTGWVWFKQLTYELQLSWAGPEPGASTQTPLEDMILTWDVTGDRRFRVTGGQFKVPLGRQEMTSSAHLQFVDRDILSGEFTRGRDVGIMVDGLIARGRLEYAAGMFNGNPASRLGNDNQAFQYNARAVFQPFGRVKYSESDFESRAVEPPGRRTLLALGLGLEHNDLHGAGARVNDYKTTIVSGDLVVKHGGLSLFGEYFGRHRQPETGPSFRSDGWHAQAGYFVIRDRLEGALRYARFDASAAPDDDVSEQGAVVSYFIRKHYLKLQGDVRRLENQDRGTISHEVRLQTQVVF